MKKMKKILCIALVLVLSLSVLVIPASAADYSITVELVDTVVGVDSTGNPLHRIVAYVDSSHSLYALNLSISYNTAAFYPVNATTLKKLPAPGKNAFDLTGTDIIFNAGATVYEDYAADGYYMEDGVHADSGYAYFASDTSPSYAKMADDALGADLKAAGYAGFYWTWKTSFGDNYLIPSGGKESSIASPLRGKVAVCAVYLAEQSDLAPGKYTVGVHDTQVNTVDGTYMTSDVIDSLSISTSDMVSITSGITVKNAEIVIEEAKSPVYEKSSQIRYNSAETNGKGSANFDVRTRAAMTADDFAEICGKDAEAINNITDVGFVYADSSVDFNIDDAKAAIAAKATTGAYAYAPVKHIQKTATEYVWTCLITYKDGMYDDAVNSVGYIVVDGETYLFDAAYATDFSDLYDTWSSKIPA